MNSDYLKVSQRKLTCGDLEQAVVRTHQPVLAAWPGRDAQRGFAPRHALGKGGGGDYQVV